MNSEIPVKINDVKMVKIESKGQKGDGIAKIDNFAIIIPNTEIDKVYKIEITNVKDKYAFARVI